MFWVLFAFLAFAVGIMLFADVQDSIPDELGWLKAPKGDFLASVKNSSESLPSQVGASTLDLGNGWIFVATPNKKTFLIEKTLSGQWSPEVGYDLPKISMMCYEARRLVTIAPMLRLATDSNSNATLSVNGKGFKWFQQEPLRAYAPNSEELISALSAGKNLKFGFTYEEAGSQTFELPVSDNKSAVDYFSKNCAN